MVGGDRRGDQRLQSADHDGVRSLDRFTQRSQGGNARLRIGQSDPTGLSRGSGDPVTT